MSIYGIFNNLDYFLIMIIVVLGVVSAIKGFFKEILGTLSLIIAFLVCFYYGSLLNIVMIKIVKIQIIANFLSYILLFLGIIFIFKSYRNVYKDKKSIVYKIIYEIRPHFLSNAIFIVFNGRGVC